jgi:hypothetical protein
MSEPMTRSVTARIRMPVEFLAVVDEWAAAHQQPRSMAVRALIMRGMAWEEAKQPQQQQPQLLAA